MTFTYALADLGDTTAGGHSLAVARYRLGDTAEDTAIFQDEEIQYQLAANAVVGNAPASLGGALVSLVHDILARLQREPDMSADWLSINWRRSSEHWWKVEAELRREYGTQRCVTTTSKVIGRPDITDGALNSYETYNRGRRDNRTVGRAR